VTVADFSGSTGVKKAYTGNGVTIDWPITFPYGEVSEIHLYLRVDDGEPDEITSNFEVNEGTLSVRYPVDGDPLEDDSELTLICETPYSQDIDLINGGPYDAEVVEAGFDKTTRILQQIREELDRAIKFPVSEDPTEEETSSVAYLAAIEAFSVAAASSAAAAAASVITAAGYSASALAAQIAAVAASLEAEASAAAAAASAAAAGSASGTKLPADLAVLKAAAVVGAPFIALATDLGQTVFFSGVAVGGSLGDGFEAI
jgi:hypothetical protein